MPRLINSFSRRDLLIDAILDVLATDGIPGLTMRTMAARAHLSAATLADHFGSRERLLTVIAFHTAEARYEQLRRAVPLIGVRAFVPDDPDDVVTARAWLAWCELGRSETYLEHTFWEARRDEERLLARALRPAHLPDQVQTAFALIEGLRQAVCAAERPMSTSRAQALLQAWVYTIRPEV